MLDHAALTHPQCGINLHMQRVGGDLVRQHKTLCALRQIGHQHAGTPRGALDIQSLQI
jgi:hypothetical protein